MLPGKKYSVSVYLNVILILLICFLICGAGMTDPLRGQDQRDQELRQLYAEHDYTAYLQSLDAGLERMSYAEFLARLYPDQQLDQMEQSQERMMYLHLSEISPEDRVLMEETGYSIRYVQLTGEDLDRYPLIGRLFVADVPFSTVRAYMYEVEELSELRGMDTAVVWNGSAYYLFVSSSAPDVLLRKDWEAWENETGVM